MLLPWFLVLGGVWGVGKLEPRFLLASPDGCECFLVFVWAIEILFSRLSYGWKIITTRLRKKIKNIKTPLTARMLVTFATYGWNDFFFPLASFVLGGGFSYCNILFLDPLEHIPTLQIKKIGPPWFRCGFFPGDMKGTQPRKLTGRALFSDSGSNVQWITCPTNQLELDDFSELSSRCWFQY